MNTKQKNDYVKSPYRCPKCNSDNITGHGFESEMNQAWQQVSCNHCNAEWREIYTLTDVEEV